MSPIRKHRGHVVLLEQLSGMTYVELLSLWLVLTLIFGASYFLLSHIPYHGPLLRPDMPDWQKFLNCIYFSVITATTTGYGDIVPMGFSKVIACAQAICSYALLAIFITKLVSYRQEIALSRVHRLTAEEMFGRVREGFYISRKDFDAAMHELHHSKTLSDRTWENLSVSLLSAQSCTEGILEFYDGEHHLYMLDERRELLMFEAMERTLERLADLLQHLTKANISIPTNVQTSLHDFTETAQATIPLWQERSPHHHKETFAALQRLLASVSQS